MLTETGCQQRQQNLWNRLPESVQWVLIGDARHVQYFCNFRVNPVSFSADQRCLLLLTRAGRSVLLADNFVRRTATAEHFADREVIVPWYTHRKSVTNRDHALLTALEECRVDTDSGNGVLEVEGVTALVASRFSDAAADTVRDTATDQDSTVGTIIKDLRRSKLPDEIQLLQRCMEAGDAGHAAAFEAVQEGASELDVYLAIQRAAEQAAGCACVVYGDFRATNAAAFKAGGLPTDYVLKNGDLFIADFSVVLHGYRSDFTNTMVVGNPSADQQRQFEACRDALQAAEAELKAGAAGAEIYQAASDVFLQNGYPALSHHCGHGLGMEHPEAPILVPESTDTLREGDVVTIEPGLYIEGVGGMRFEHNYVVTESGSRRLSNHHLGLTKD